jgi:delta 1-pyrroline-5-carboxylate dehydrogenase
VLNGAVGLSTRSAGNPKRRRLAALHNPPCSQAGARWKAACSRTGRRVECGEMSPLSMPAERETDEGLPSQGQACQMGAEIRALPWAVVVRSFGAGEPE